MLFCTTIFAQKGNKGNMPSDGIIKGIVKEATGDKPVMYANIVIYSKRDSSIFAGAVTDETGTFFIKDVSYGRYYLIANSIGYHKDTVIDIKVFPKKKIYNCGTIRLQQAEQEIEEIEVNAEKSYIQYKIDKKVINISKNINATGGTLTDALENTPSINVDIDGNVTLRGSSDFMVLIDGKPSVLDANDVLQQIPASAVENVEIITNPSAKYDPDGTTGIINIIMKKEFKTGFNGIINVSVGTGDKYSTDFLFNYRAKKFNFFVGAKYGKRKHSRSFDSKTYMNDSTNSLITKSDINHQRNHYSANAGFDYYISEKTTLTLSGKYGYFGFERNINSNNYEYNIPISEELFSKAKGYFNAGGNYYSTNIDFKHDFDKIGHELSASLNYSDRNVGLDNDNSEQITDKNWSALEYADKIRTFQSRSRLATRIKVDYTYPINETDKFETGYQYRLRKAEGDYKYEKYDNTSEIWIDNSELSNELIFKRTIHSIYATYSGKIIGLQYLAGFRTEYTDRLIDQKTMNEKYTYNKFDFFPTLHLTKELNEKQQLQLSYSRRVRRPRHWYLNPFPNYSDSYYKRVGNPTLTPEFSDAYEINWQYQAGNSLFVIEGYYRQTNNGITRVQELIEDNIILMTFDNIDKTNNLGVEVSGNFQAFKWWRLSANINFYRHNIESETSGEVIEVSNTEYNSYISSTFIFTKTSRIQLNGFYSGPEVTAQGNAESFYSFSFALRQDFFKRKLSVNFRVRDPFKMQEYIYDTKGDNFSTHSKMNFEAPIFILSLSYKLNNYKQKRKKGEKSEGEEYDGGM